MRRSLIQRLPLSSERAAKVERCLGTVPALRELQDLKVYREGQAVWECVWDGRWTMLGARRGRTLHRLARKVEQTGVGGALVDCGVWNGGSTILLARGAPSRDVWAFDSFEGLPKPDERDGRESLAFEGDCRGSEEALRAGFAELAGSARLHVRRGWFDQTLPESAPQIGPIAILHVDGDWYRSVLLTLETFYRQVSPGGYIVIDDYGTWPGAREATDEFRTRMGDGSRLVRVDHTGRYWRKPV